MMHHKKDQETVMTRIIKLSKLVISIKACILVTTHGQKLANRINEINLFEKPQYEKILSELKLRLKEVNQSIERLMKPLFQEKEFEGYNESEDWALCGRELKQGFVRLKLKDRDLNYILFLSSYKDVSHSILEGSLHPENQKDENGKELIVPILSNQKDMLGDFIDINKFLCNLII